jgi:two-component system sensor histidine kinase BaeS
VTAERALTPLAVRLAAAFVAVAVVAVAVLSALIVFVADHETAQLNDREHRSDARAAAVAAADAYTHARSWDGADLTAAAVVAAGSHAQLTVADTSGAVVAAPTDDLARMMGEMHGVNAIDGPRGHPVTEPVVVNGRSVGSVTLAFPLDDSPAEHVRDVLWRTVIVGASIAAAVALVVALVVATRLTGPLVALTAAATRLARGDRAARAAVDGPGELGELSRAFDDMAGQLETEDRVRRQFVSDMAHELRTPIAILQGETEALLDGVVDADAASLGSLHDEALRLGRLVADLETLAAADAARLTMHPVACDLADVAGRAVATLRTAAAERAITLTAHLAPAPTVGDADRLHQVALNLLSNAIKFTPPGGTVTVSTAAVEHHAVLTVDDTGPGLADGEAEHVFERFWQGAAGRSTAQGSGIGLAVAAGIVAAHRGTLSAAGHDAGPGARFRLDLPA